MLLSGINFSCKQYSGKLNLYIVPFVSKQDNAINNSIHIIGIIYNRSAEIQAQNRLHDLSTLGANMHTDLQKWSVKNNRRELQLRIAVTQHIGKSVRCSKHEDSVSV